MLVAGDTIVSDTLICFPDMVDALRVTVPKKTPNVVKRTGVIVVKLLFSWETELSEKQQKGTKMNDLKTAKQKNEINLEISVSTEKATDQTEKLIGLLKSASSLVGELADTLKNLELDVKI